MPGLPAGRSRLSGVGGLRLAAVTESVTPAVMPTFRWHINDSPCCHTFCHTWRHTCCDTCCDALFVAIPTIDTLCHTCHAKNQRQIDLPLYLTYENCVRFRTGDDLSAVFCARACASDLIAAPKTVYVSPALPNPSRRSFIPLSTESPFPHIWAAYTLFIPKTVYFFPKTVYAAKNCVRFPPSPPLTSERGWSPAGGRDLDWLRPQAACPSMGELPGSPMPRPQWGLGDASRASTDAWEEGTAPRRGPQAYIVSLVGYTLDGTLPLTGYRPYRRRLRQLGSGTRLVEEAGNPAKAVSGVRDPLTG